jgi:hypothetical protein
MWRASLAVAWLALALRAGPAGAQELELRWSRPRAFLHEQIQLEAVVEHPIGLNPRWEAPPFDGFVIERLPSEGSTMRRSPAGGYVRTTRLRHALFPTRSGVIEVAPSRIVFLDVGGSEMSLSVPATRLAVDDLPEAGRPPGFDAAVGTLSVRATLTPTSIALGEHARLELDVFGVANVWDVAAPDLEAALGPACEVFSEPPQLDRAVHDEALFARKTFRFALVPGAQGRLAIPALRVAHFDPDALVYRVASSDPLELEVGPTRAAAAVPPTSSLAPAEPAPGVLAWLPTWVLLASAAGVAVALARGPRPAPAEPRAVAPAPVAPRAAPEELLRRAEDALEEPGFGALLARALRAACAPGDASLTTGELAARTSDVELIALLRAVDAERFSGRASLAERRALLDAAVAWLRNASEARARA